MTESVRLIGRARRLAAHVGGSTSTESPSEDLRDPFHSGLAWFRFRLFPLSRSLRICACAASGVC